MSTFVETQTESSGNCNPNYQTNVKSSDLSSNNVPAWGKKSPWGGGSGHLVSPPPCSLVDVMSEQLALELNKEETMREMNSNSSDLIANLPLSTAAEGVDLTNLSEKEIQEANDEVMARLLQQQFDKEDDDKLRIEEKKYNGNNKVSISFEKFRVTPTSEYDDDFNYTEDNDEQKTEWENPIPDFGRCGISGKGKNITTKHDPTICGRRNASKLMEFSDNSGDGEGMDLKLPNDVFNRLKVHSNAMNKRHQKVHEKKEHSTAIQAIDMDTQLILFQMVNSGIIDDVHGIVSTGKESVVLSSAAGDNLNNYLDNKHTKRNNQLLDGNNEVCPSVCAIKVFKTTLTDFKERKIYVIGDSRFSQDNLKKMNPRKIIQKWTKKEAANLHRMRRHGIPCPTVICQKKHVLVMSFIGHEFQAAPQLRKADLNPNEMEQAFKQTVEILCQLYNDCQLVHADFSEYNLLWHNNSVWVIDVSQAVEINHKHALEFLFRDCINISKFFKASVNDVPSAEQLFNEITQLNFVGEGSEFLDAVKHFDEEQKKNISLHERHNKNDYAFDYFWEQSKKQPNHDDDDDDEHHEEEKENA